MWFLISLAAALSSTILSLFLRGRFRLGTLSLMLWGGTIMLCVDRLLGPPQGSLFALQTSGLVRNAALLGALMLAPVLCAWAVMLARARWRLMLRRSGAAGADGGVRVRVE